MQNDSRKTEPILARVMFIMVFMIGIALSIKSMIEPDIWWMLRTGEWIVQNMHVPDTDVFSYTMAGKEWTNVKWLFEVLIYSLQAIGGPAFVMVLQAIVSSIMIWFLWKTYRLITPLSADNIIPMRVGWVIAMLIGLVTIEFRMIGRPEMISHLFSTIFIYLLLNDRLKHDRKIYWLIPLQLLWANLHEAFGTGIVIALIFWGGAVLEFIYRKIKSEPALFPKKLTLIILLMTLSTAIHPAGLKMIIHPYEIYTQLNLNKYTYELVSFSDPLYWRAESYLNAVLVLIALGFLIFQGVKNKLVPALREIGPAYSLLVFAFFFLSLNANRNIPFSILAVVPVTGVLISLLLKQVLPPGTKNRNAVYAVCCLLLIAFYSWIVSGNYYKFRESKYSFGLQVDALKNPTAASAYIAEQKISGVCFSDYLISSALLWQLRPGFKTFIDLRDLDVFPPDFFDEFSHIINDTTYFKKADSTYHFDYVVLFRKEFSKLHYFLSNTTDYTPVYADGIAAVYLKSKTKNTGDFFHLIKPSKPSLAASAINHILNPFYKQDDFKTVNQLLPAAEYYHLIGYENLALGKLNAMKNKDRVNPYIYTLEGNIYIALAKRTDNAQTKTGYIASAENAFRSAIGLVPGYTDALNGMATCAALKGDQVASMKTLEQTVNQNPANLQSLMQLIDTYEDLSRKHPEQKEEYIQKRLDALLQLNSLSPGSPFIALQIAYSYHLLGMCDKARPYLEEIKDFDRYDKVQREELDETMKSCL